MAENTQADIQDIVSSTPTLLLDILQCVDCNSSALIMDKDQGKLSCSSCNASFPVHLGVPGIMKGGPEEQDWNMWDNEGAIRSGHTYYRRANGELPEKEASKSYANLINREGYYRPGDLLLDIGCATGHFLRSFRRIIDPEIRYVGLDSEAKFVHWGSEIFGLDETCAFVHANALAMPFRDNTFDTVIVNLFHFFSNIEQALKETMRVTKKRIIWRTPVSQANYIIKAIFTPEFEELGVLTPDRDDLEYTLTMMYTREYIEGLVNHLGGKVVHFEKDTDFGEFDNTALPDFKGFTATKTMHGMQVNGNLIYDWHYVVIESS